ncbi:MAG TPA: transketolase [Candidatus Nanoarchaeia archaeon]|nr:transketolase [Candidatus Nanoarchaeia archaeon]
MTKGDDLAKIASILRRDVLEMTSAAGSGHPTSCLSSAEIASVLFFDIMKYDPKKPGFSNNDEFILSKGHAAPLLYSVLQRAGCIKEKLTNLRKSDSILEGHPTPLVPWVKAASGSLGQGLSVGAGIALAAKKQKKTYCAYVLMGDSEFAEGSNYEAMNFASANNLDNLYAIIDMNGLGQTGKTMISSAEEYRARFNACGWATAVVDGHSISELREMLTMMRDLGKPVAIIAKTVKGKGVSFLENAEGWHGRALNKKELSLALKEIPLVKMPSVEERKPSVISTPHVDNKLPPITSYKENEDYSTREAFGNALLRLAKFDPHLMTIDGEVNNSTFTSTVKTNLPQQFIQGYIAEQNMIGLALGLSKKNHSVFASTFSAFLSRAHDQLRMASISQANFVVNGSHCGCSIGEDGASQMGLEDIAMFRSLPESTILYPSDAYSAERLTEISHGIKQGIVYIRTSRPKLPLLYTNKDKFELGKFKVLQESNKDQVVLIGSGVTTHESLKAAKQLKKEKIIASVIDLYSIYPLNIQELKEFILKHGNKVVVSEDHYAAGGIGEMLKSQLYESGISLSTLAVKNIPHSASMQENLKAAGIDFQAIADAAKKLIKS